MLQKEIKISSLFSRREFLHFSGLFTALVAIAPRKASKIVLETGSSPKPEIPKLEFPEWQQDLTGLKFSEPILTHDIQIERRGYPPLFNQENPPLTELDKEEIRKAHARLKGFYEEHPEITDQAGKLWDRLGLLGFPEDPTPIGVLEEATLIEFFGNTPNEGIVGLCERERVSKQVFLDVVDCATGERKKQNLREAKETKYWTPSGPNEDVVLHMLQEVNRNLFGWSASNPIAGHYIEEVSFASVPESQRMGKEDIQGRYSTGKRINIYLADDFQEVDDLVTDSLGQAAELFEAIFKSFAQVDASVWIRISSNRDLQEFAGKNLGIANEAMSYIGQMTEMAATEKVGMFSRVSRHELAHGLDPLLGGQREGFSLLDRLFALNEISGYLEKNPKLAQVPAGKENSDSSILWNDVLDIPHTTWADSFTGATSTLKEDQESVTREQTQMIDRILKTAELGISLERIKEVYQQASESATQLMLRDYQEGEPFKKSLNRYNGLVKFREFLDIMGPLPKLPTLVPTPGLARVTPSPGRYSSSPTPFPESTPWPTAKMIETRRVLEEATLTPVPTNTRRIPTPTSTPPRKEIVSTLTPIILPIPEKSKGESNGSCSSGKIIGVMATAALIIEKLRGK